MKQSLLFLGIVGAVIYALLVVMHGLLPVAPSTQATTQRLAGQTRPNAFGPDRLGRFNRSSTDSSVQIAKQMRRGVFLAKTSVPPRYDEEIWFVVSRAARLHAGPS